MRINLRRLICLLKRMDWTRMQSSSSTLRLCLRRTRLFSNLWGLRLLRWILGRIWRATLSMRSSWRAASNKIYSMRRSCFSLTKKEGRRRNKAFLIQLNGLRLERHKRARMILWILKITPRRRDQMEFRSLLRSQNSSLSLKEDRPTKTFKAWFKRSLIRLNFKMTFFEIIIFCPFLKN